MDAAPTLLTDLPEELLALVLASVSDGYALLAARRTCRVLRRIVDDDTLGFRFCWPTLRFTSLPCTPRTVVQRRATAVVVEGDFRLGPNDCLELHRSYPGLASVTLDCGMVGLMSNDVATEIRRVSRLTHLVVAKESACSRSISICHHHYSLLHPHLESVDVSFADVNDCGHALDKLLAASPRLSTVTIRRCIRDLKPIAARRFDNVTSLTIECDANHFPPFELDGTILERAFPSLVTLGLVRVPTISPHCTLPNLTRLRLVDPLRHGLGAVRADGLRTLEVRRERGVSVCTRRDSVSVPR
jgi:hypothetical protein